MRSPSKSVQLSCEVYFEDTLRRVCRYFMLISVTSQTGSPHEIYYSLGIVDDILTDILQQALFIMQMLCSSDPSACFAFDLFSNVYDHIISKNLFYGLT